MEDNDDLLKQKLEAINKESEEAMKNSLNNIKKKIETTTKELKEKAYERIERREKFIKKFFVEPKYNLIPKIYLKPHQNLQINTFINVILFSLANLETFTEFCLEENYKEILKNLPGKKEESFIVSFISFLKNSREFKNNNHDYKTIHSCLERKLGNNYISQDPEFLIRNILDFLVKDLISANKIKNIITNNFQFTLKTIKTCNRCKLLIHISNKEQLLVDLFFKKPEEKIQERFLSVFKSLLIDKETEDKKEPCLGGCGHNMAFSRIIENPKKYLILNLNRKYDPNYEMKLIYSTSLKLTEEKEDIKYEHEYDLILALTDKKINDINNYKLYFKNFVNEKWYKYVSGDPQEIQGNIQDDISNQNPNILIYKKKSVKIVN